MITEAELMAAHALGWPAGWEEKIPTASEFVFPSAPEIEWDPAVADGILIEVSLLCETGKPTPRREV